MSLYRVTWLIDIEADAPEEAARKALAIHRNPASNATCFEVTDRTVGGETTSIDLLWSDLPAPEDSAAVLLRVTLSALNAHPRFRLGHVDSGGKEYRAGTATLRDSYQLASAIETCLARSSGGEGA